MVVMLTDRGTQRKSYFCVEKERSRAPVLAVKNILHNLSCCTATLRHMSSSSSLGDLHENFSRVLVRNGTVESYT
jgi:hypothetical protein